MICPFCKETIQDGCIKCRHCGSFLHGAPGAGPQPQGLCPPGTLVLTPEEIQAFVGDNAHYYITNFGRFTLTGTEKFTLTWNWATCLFTFFWMLYRKMYVHAAVTFVIFCIPGVNILLHIIAGATGNYLYFKHAKDRILEVRATSAAHHGYSALQLAGGVNTWVIPVGIIMGLIIIALMSFIFGAMLSLFSQ